MSVQAFDWAVSQRTRDYTTQAVLTALGAIAGDNHQSQVNLGELAETINHPPRIVREILAELEQKQLIKAVHPVNTSGYGLVVLQLGGLQA